MAWKAHNSLNPHLKEAVQAALDVTSPGHIIGIEYNSNDNKWYVAYWTEE